MKILVISDTHRNLQHFGEVLQRESPVNMLIHCGDICGDEEKIRTMCGCDFYAVAGNMDMGSELPGEALIEAGGRRIFAVHGHRYYVGSGTEDLKETALEKGADIVLYGHTHIPGIEETKELTVLNPGSLSYPRQYDKRESYGIIEIGQRGKISCKICYLSENDE